MHRLGTDDAGRAGQTGQMPAARLGARVETFDARYTPAGGAAPAASASAPYRRVYEIDEGRLVAEVLPDGRVRQLTIGRVRGVEDTWEPEPGDWSLAQARQIAVRWLPADARPVRSEPFSFRDQVGGVRDLYTSAVLAKVFSAADYAAMHTAGLPGSCSAAFYQTSDGGVAFVLVGLY